MAHQPYSGDDRGVAPRHPAVELPRLELPTFSLRTDAAHAAPARPQADQHDARQWQRQAPAPAPSTYGQPPAAPQARPYVQAPYHHAPHAYAPQPQPHAQHQHLHLHLQAQAHHHHQQPQHHAAAAPAGRPPVQAQPRQPVVQRRPTAQPPRLAAASATPAAYYAPAPQEGFFGGRVSPVQVGIAMTLLVFVLIIARGGPSAMDVTTPGALPAAVSPITAAEATLPMRKKPQGIPSPAAAAALIAAKSGKRPVTKLGSIPSPEAASKMSGASETLPMHADDGASLPAGADERDAHAAEHHYGGSQTLPMEKPVERPVLTPGESAQAAQMHSHDVVVSSDNEYVVRPGTAF